MIEDDIYILFINNIFASNLVWPSMNDNLNAMNLYLGKKICMFVGIKCCANTLCMGK